MTFSVKYTFEAIDRFTQTAKKIGKALVNDIGKKAKLASEKLKKAGDAMMRVGKSLTIGLTAPIVAAGIAMVKSSDDMEHFKNRLHVAGLATDKLNIAYKKLNDFIISTPFDMKDMQDASVTLLATGDSVDSVIKKMKTFGDISALTSMSMNEVASMMAKAQASSRGVNMVFTELGEKGVLIRKELIKMAAEMGHVLTDKQLDKQIQAGYVTFPILMKSFDNLRKKGQELHGQMAAMSSEVGPLLGSFKTAIVSKILAPLGDSIIETLKIKEHLNSWIAYILANQDKITLFIKTHKALIKMTIAFTAILSIIGPVLAGLALIVFTISALLSPITLVVLAIAAVAAGVTYLYLKFAWFRDLVKVVSAMFKFGFKIDMIALKATGKFLKFVFIDPIMLAIKLLNKFTSLLDHHVAVGKTGLLGHSKGRDYKGGLMGSMFPSFKMHPQTVNSHVNISLNDPGGAVKSVGAKSDGRIGFNLGANMQASR